MGGWRRRTQGRLLFHGAQRQNSQDSDDAFFDLMQGAWALDSTDTDAGMTLGYYIMALGQRDTVYAARATA